MIRHPWPATFESLVNIEWAFLQPRGVSESCAYDVVLGTRQRRDTGV